MGLKNRQGYDSRNCSGTRHPKFRLEEQWSSGNSLENAAGAILELITVFSSNMSRMSAKKAWVLGADDLASWFLRLNGCLTMVNFVVHGRQRLKPGEFDILAVRFPDRREVLPPDEVLDDH